MLTAYFKLRSRIDRLVQSIRARYSEQILCQPTCIDCCQAGLTLVLVEAVAIGSAHGVEPERIHLQAGQSPRFSEGRCSLLDEKSLCAVYNDRPLICRTHGLPLKYSDSNEIRVCEKNFIYQTPHRSAMLNVDNMETALFAVNLEYCRRAGLNPMGRVPIDRLVQLIGKSC
ncbi:MAG: YkgJ family cysteine cluster protein [Myxococcota bacterium]|nr:YkgJ family cysteine cluster protein [Myxococcota bacterium]